MFKQYINKNKLLFTFSLIIFTQLLFSIALITMAFIGEKYFNSIKTNSEAQTNMSSINYSFWNYLWKSGEIMSTYGNVVRLTGYQDTSLKDLIINLFTGNKTQPSGNTQSASSTTSSLIPSFQKFNLVIQLSATLLCVIGIMGSINIALFGFLIWNCFLTSKPFHFKRLFLSLLFNLPGFILAYKLETNLLEEPKESEWMSKLQPWKTIRDLHESKKNLNISDNNGVILEVKNLNYKIGKSPNYILKDINFQIKTGSFNVIIGPNGSGKTTLIKSLINLQNITSGEILWNGKQISKINRTEFARQVSYIPQFLNLQNPISILDFLQYSRYPYRQIKSNSPEIDKQMVLSAIDKNNCKNLKDRMLNELSGGQKQKILLTSVLTQDSEVIVLDEPTSFLDLKNQHQFLETLKNFHQKGKTIIMILHDLRQSIGYADNLIVLEEGKIKSMGHPKDVINKKLLNDVFKIDCNIHTANDVIQIDNIYAL